MNKYKRYIYLINKNHNENLSTKEKEELIDIINKEEVIEKHLEELLYSADPNIENEKKEHMFGEICSNIMNCSNKQKKDKIYHTYIKYSAIIILPILITFSIIGLNERDIPHEGLVTISAGNGSITNITLPDNTEVSLNSGSKLIYNSLFGSSSRTVRLDGEAYFKVTHNEEHPFIVETENVNVKVLGTTFNISAYPESEKTSIVLLEGKVCVNTKNEIITITPGEKATYEKNTGKLSINAVNPNDYTIWTNGGFYFDNESLPTILKQLSRKYNIPIIIKSNILNGEHFSGVIPDISLREALNILKMASSFNYEIYEDSITVTNN